MRSRWLDTITTWSRDDVNIKVSYNQCASGVGLEAAAAAGQYRVSVRTGVSCPVDVWNWSTPPPRPAAAACGGAAVTFSLDDLHATPLGDYRRRFFAAGQLLVKRDFFKTLRVKSKLLFFCFFAVCGASWGHVLSVVAAFKGADWAPNWQLKLTPNIARAVLFLTLLAFTWCTQSPEVPANLLHNEGQVS